ncbi:MAG: cyclic nucleotide-gated ion channel [Rhodospirillales bacterium]
MRHAIFHYLDGDGARRFGGRTIAGFLIVFILISVVVALAETDRGLARFDTAFDGIETAAALIFTIEYALRVWIAPEGKKLPHRSPSQARRDYLISPRGVIDLLAIAPFWLGLVTPMGADVLLQLQVLRILKLMRYSSAIETLGSVLRNEIRPLIAAGVIMLTLLVLFSTLMYLAERHAQPEKFGSSVDALWWGVVTLATVGYGDTVPITAVGKILGGITVILGLGMFALPAAILASGFAEEIRKRNFVVTWNLVAKVPLFSDLPAIRIAEIAAMLKPRSAERGEAIVRKGERADCMYFIVSGEADVIVPPSPVRLHSGDFFGEIALLVDTRRTADVIAVTFNQLLMLPVSDFRNLLAAYPELKHQLQKVAEERLAASHIPHTHLE